MSSRRFRRDFTVLKSDHLFGEMSVYNSDLGPLLPTTLFYIVFDCALFPCFQLCFISVSIPQYFQYVLFTVFSAAIPNIHVIVVRVYMGRACKGNPFMKIHLLILLCWVYDEVRLTWWAYVPFGKIHLSILLIWVHVSFRVALLFGKLHLSILFIWVHISLQVALPFGKIHGINSHCRKTATIIQISSCISL